MGCFDGDEMRGPTIVTGPEMSSDLEGVLVVPAADIAEIRAVQPDMAEPAEAAGDQPVAAIGIRVGTVGDRRVEAAPVQNGIGLVEPVVEPPSPWRARHAPTRIVECWVRNRSPFAVAGSVNKPLSGERCGVPAGLLDERPLDAHPVPFVLGDRMPARCAERCTR